MNDDRPHYEAELRADKYFKKLVDPQSLRFLSHVDEVDLWLCDHVDKDETNIAIVSPNYLGQELWYWIDLGGSWGDRDFEEVPVSHPARAFLNNYSRLHQ